MLKKNGALKSHNTEKLKGAPFEVFQHPFCRKKLKKTKIFIFGKKSQNAEKILKGGTLWEFSTSILSQNIKKMQGGTLWGKFFFRKKSLAVPKKMKGGSLWSRPVWYVTRKNRKNLFVSVR